MFTSNIQFGYPCRRGGGQAVQAGLSCAPLTPPPSRRGFGSNSIISKFLLPHNLGIFSYKRCELYFSQTEMFTPNVQFRYPLLQTKYTNGGGGGAGKLSRLVYLAPAKDLGQTVSSVNSYCTIILKYLVVRDVNFISAKLRCLHPTFSLVTHVRGVKGKLSWLVYLAPPPPPPRIWVKQCHQLILIVP